MNYRLALYSEQECPGTQEMDLRLMKLIGVERPKIGYIASSPSPKPLFFGPKKAFYEGLGAVLDIYADVENYSDELEELFGCDAIHLSGGNTFGFLTWLRKAGLLTKLKHYASQGGILIGESAGAILMTSSIETSLLCGDDVSMSDGDHSGLALVSFNIWPHYTQGSEQSPVARKLLSKLGLTYGCPDGSGFVIDKNKVEVFGEVHTF